MPRDAANTEPLVEEVYESAYKMGGAEQLFEFLLANPPTLREIGPGVALIENSYSTIRVSHGADALIEPEVYVAGVHTSLARHASLRARAI